MNVYYIYDPVTESYLKSHSISFGKVIGEWTKNIHRAHAYQILYYAREMRDRLGEGCILVNEDGDEIE